MKQVDYTALSDNMNIDLCSLESATYMLSLANKQYRLSCERNLDRKVIDFFSEKVSVYSEYRENLFNDIHYDMLSLKTSLFNRMIDDKRILWNEFKKAYPESNLNFEDVFVGNVAVYPEAQKGIEQGKVKAQYSPLSKAFYEYSLTYIESEQLKNFESLLGDVYNQVNSMGATPFVANGVSERNAVVPGWLIENLDVNAESFYRDLKKQALKLGVEIRALHKLEKSHATDEEIKLQCEALDKKFEEVNSNVLCMEDMFLALDAVAARLDASTKKWKFGEVEGQLVEKILEFTLGIPRDIKKLTPGKDSIIISKAEAEFIANNALYSDGTIMDGLLLAKYCGINPKLELSELKQSKKVLGFIRGKEVQINSELSELNKEPVKNQDKIVKLKNYLNATSVLHFETPFGLVNYNNGELVNLQTNQTYDVNCLLNNQNIVISNNSKVTTPNKPTKK